MIAATLALGATVSGTPSSSSSTTSPRIWVSSAFYAPERCNEARRALSYYRAAYARHRAAQELAGPVPVVRYGCAATRRRAVEWRDRAGAERVRAAEWYRANFAWSEWLPDKWQRVGACETGYGRRPGNWTHDSGTYVSAFGIYRAGYDDDAHRIGNLGWDETKRELGRLPTPREQYEAALSHYRAHGGFSGWGCRGA